MPLDLDFNLAFIIFLDREDEVIHWICTFFPF